MIRRLVPGPIRRLLRDFRAPSAKGASVSSDYQPIAPGDSARVAAQLANAWQSDAIPHAQLAVVEDELRRFSQGRAVPVFDVFVDLLRQIPEVNRMTLLEVG